MVSSVPKEFVFLLAETQRLKSQGTVRLPLMRANGVELSLKHSIQLVEHQDMYKSLASSHLIEVQDLLEAQKEKLVEGAGQEVFDSMFEKVTTSVIALNNSFDLFQPLINHLAPAQASIELARKK